MYIMYIYICIYESTLYLSFFYLFFIISAFSPPCNERVAEQIDPKDHEDVVAEKNKLAQALTDAVKAKGVLESNKADLSRRMAAVQKEKDDAMASRNKIGAQVGVHRARACRRGCMEGGLRFG